MKTPDIMPVGGAERPVFLCSFGKDSSVLLHALDPVLDKVLVVFIDCGGLYPDILEWVDQQKEVIPNFLHWKTPGDIWEFVRDKGFPLPAVPPELSEIGPFLGAEKLAEKYRVQPWTNCVAQRFWLPMISFLKHYKPDIIITGEKSGDRPYLTDYSFEDGWPYHKPLFNWTDEEVWEYIDAHNIELSESFQGRQKDRRDCWVCMGGHDFTVARMRELKNRWPELHKKLFEEEGLGELLPAYTKILSKNLRVLKEMQRCL